MTESLSVRIMKYVKEHPTASNREIAEAVGCTQSQARGNISSHYVRGFMRRTDDAGSDNTYSRRLAVTEKGEEVISGARNYNPNGRIRNSKPPEQKGEPIKRPCLMCRDPFESKDRRKEWICCRCKQLAEYQAA